MGNAHNKQKQKRYNIITKNDEGLFDHEDKGPMTHRNVGN
jgi:hypothetical protein